ncbi:MAG: dihydroneopterin aldolase, partial [Paracoccaceae bacterium]
MSTDKSIVFESLEARSNTETEAAPPDRISLRGHVVDVEIGAFQVERDVTQRLSFDVVVEVAADAAPLEDDVDRILSYDTLTNAISHELAAERLNLLETLADRIAMQILTSPQAMRVFLRIQKLDRGPGALGVEIVRSKANASNAVEALETAPRRALTFVYFSNAAVRSDRMSDWLTQLQQLESPVLICVAPLGLVSQYASTGTAKQHIDLLAIEQNAWVLAGRDRRCIVVSTKT